MRTYKKLIAAGAMAATAMAVAVVPAIADPPKGVTPPVKSIVGVGSDTIQFVFDQFSNDYNKTKPAEPLYSYDAVNPKTHLPGDMIVSKKGCPKEPRPNGSTGGLQAATGGPLALGANLKDPKGGFCTDFARASRPVAAGDPPNANFIPFATDAVTWAANAKTHAPANLTIAQLTAIYSCHVTNWHQVGGSFGHINAQLPQAGSGTRKFFLSEIGLSVSGPGLCVGSTAEENEGTNSVLAGKNTIFPYSVADYIAQTLHSAKCGAAPRHGQNLFGCDDHGTMVLHKIAGVSPTINKGAQLNPKFPFTRLVFVVVRGPGVPKALRALFGSKGWLLTNKTAAADICAYGFATLGKRGC